MRKLERLLSLLTYAYLLRFPLLTALAIVGIFYAAFCTIARSLLANLFDISWGWGIFFLSLTAFNAAWVVMLTLRLVLLYGAERFGIEQYQVNANVKWRHIALSSLIALPMVCGAIYYSTNNTALEITEAVLGLIASLLLLGTAAIIRKFFTRPQYTKRPTDTARGSSNLAETSPDMFLPLNNKRVAPVINRVSRLNPASRPAQMITNLFRHVPKSIGRGYFEYDDDGKVVSILPGHALAFNLLILTLIFYIVTGIIKFANLGYTPTFPTLGYVLLLLMLICWGFSGLAFFLDRFRIPVLIPLLLLLSITSRFPWSDHFYPVTDRVRVSEQTQQTVSTVPAPLEERATPGDNIIVVAVNGGGIQAEAWAARVLTGLEKELDEKFGRSIRVVSSVSGGSVGAMYFVNEYTPDGPPSGSELDEIVKRAKASDLDEVAWGLVYPDLIRLATSYGSEWDRGRALEESWLRKEFTWKNRDNIRVGLSKWREDTRAGWRPGLIFNTTITDNGERLPISTIDLPPGSKGRIVQDQFFESLNWKDIQVVTTTRLSASFPYVSPAARANVSSRNAAHIVDGGYYDNYGISSIVEWLDAELYKGNIKRVLVLQILGSRTGGDLTFKTSRGWFYQAFAPLGTLLHVRDTGQISHNDIELKLLIDKWNGKVSITPVIFEFRGADPPLSWHLNEREKNAIELDWESEVNGSKAKEKGLDKSELDVVREFLEQPPPQ